MNPRPKAAKDADSLGIKRSLMKIVSKRILGAILALACLVLMPGCKTSQAPGAQAEAAAAPVVTTPKVRTDIQTMLVMGISEYDDGQGGAFRSGSRADLLLLIVMDQGKKEAVMLQLNPDTMVPYTQPGTQDRVEMPLGLVISYGSGGSDSCLSQRKAVSRLLGDVPVDHYMTITPDSIAVVSDMLGGIFVSPTEAFLGSHGQQEEPLLLQGELAKEFFSYRNQEDVENEDHMERQRRFMTALFPLFMEKAQDDEFLMELTMELGEGFDTDLTLSQMVTLLQELGTYELKEEIVTLPGNAELVEDVPQFRVEEESRDRLVEDLFYE